MSRAFDGARLSTGPLVGVSMSLSGPRERFESLFEVTLEPDGDGGWAVVDEADRSGDGAPRRQASGNPPGGQRELPTARLPPAITEGVQSIVFDAPVTLDAGEPRHGERTKR